MESTSNNPESEFKNQQEICKKVDDVTPILTSSAEFHHSRLVVICVDGSDYTLQLIEWSIKNILHRISDKVILINVRKLASESVSTLKFGVHVLDFGGDFLDHLDNEYMKASHDILRGCAKILKQAGIETEAYALRGNTKSILYDKIMILKPDIIVMGKKGTTGISQLFLGSIASYIMQNTPFPVVLVPML